MINSESTSRFLLPETMLWWEKKKFFRFIYIKLGFPGDSNGKDSACDTEDPGSVSGLGILSPGEWNSNPFQYFCLENSMDRGAWRTTVHEVAKSRTQLSD